MKRQKPLIKFLTQHIQFFRFLRLRKKMETSVTKGRIVSFYLLVDVAVFFNCYLAAPCNLQFCAIVKGRA